MVMMTQATGSPSASSLHNGGLSVTPGAPALWGGKQGNLPHPMADRRRAQPQALVNNLCCSGISDSPFQALKVHIPLEGKVFCGRGLDRDVNAASPQKLSICPVISKDRMHPSNTA